MLYRHLIMNTTVKQTYHWCDITIYTCTIDKTSCLVLLRLLMGPT